MSSALLPPTVLLITDPNIPSSLPSWHGGSLKQASARFPENTLASFEAAIQDGAEGIESGNSIRPHPFSRDEHSRYRRPRFEG